MANDGEMFGMRLAIGDLHDGLARKDSEYNNLLAAAQKRIAETDAMLKLARAERDAANAQVGKLKWALAMEQCHSAGLYAKGDAYRVVIQQNDAGHQLLQETGLTYEDGVREKFSGRVYDKAFDEKAASMGLTGNLRTVAR